MIRVHQTNYTSTTLRETAEPISPSTHYILRLKSREAFLLQRLEEMGLQAEEFRSLLQDGSYESSPPKTRARVLCHLLFSLVQPSFPQQIDEAQFVELGNLIKESISSLGLEPETEIQSFQAKREKQIRKMDKRKEKERLAEEIRSAFEQATRGRIFAAAVEYNSVSAKFQKLQERVSALVESRDESAIKEKVDHITKKLNELIASINQISQEMEQANGLIAQEEVHYQAILQRAEDLLGRIE
ncbi:MAG: hypothetical protein KGI80_02515 [Verrucomicrobiota bacterium]|nr:hypothetical protein [Verrucomicrobiota bacterium]